MQHGHSAVILKRSSLGSMILLFLSLCFPLSCQVTFASWNVCRILHQCQTNISRFRYMYIRCVTLHQIHGLVCIPRFHWLAKLFPHNRLLHAWRVHHPGFHVARHLDGSEHPQARSHDLRNVTRTMFHECKVLIFAVICEQNRIFWNYNDVNKENFFCSRSSRNCLLSCRQFLLIRVRCGSCLFYI